MIDGKYGILVVDDESEIRDILTLLLTGEGYHVVSADCGKAAIEAASNDIDLYILDVNMPDMSGYILASKLRENYDAPIVFLTAYSGESDKVMGFSVGCDDYIVKPFSNMELLMRVKAMLRRAAASDSRTSGDVNNSKSANEIVIGDIVLNTDTESVEKNGQALVLTYTEFKILELLATNPKKIFSLDSIYESIWQEEAVSDSAIMMHIKNLRKKLGDDSRNPKYIKTAWGRGYYVD